jgi:hypothetical protein
LRSISQQCSPASRTTTDGCASQVDTTATASATLSGCSKTLGLVLILKKARIVTQARQTGPVPENVFSTQARQRTCWSERG